MKKTILAAAFVLLATPALAADWFGEWRTSDTVAESVFATLVLVDVMQTRYALDQDGQFVEQNPVLGKNPDKLKLYGLALGGLVLHAGITKAIPPDWRIFWHEISICAELQAIGSNAFMVGSIRLKF